MTQPPMQPTPITLRARRDQAHAAMVDAMIDIMARPGWVDFILTAPLDDEDKTLMLRLIVGLHKTTIDRAGQRMAAQWRRARAQRGRVRLIKGRRVRSSLHQRRLRRHTLPQ